MIDEIKYLKGMSTKEELARMYLEEKQELKNLIKFIQTYHYLTEEQRKEVCASIKKEPYSWNVVFNEVINDTLLSRMLLANINWIGLEVK